MPDQNNMAIIAPAGYVPATALAFDDGNGNALVAQRSHPLPTTPVLTAATSAPVSGATAASGSFGPFTPELARPIWVSLSGSWSGTARLLRSTDGGATKLPLTVAGEAWAVFRGNASEPVTEDSSAAATYYLDVALTGGTLTYRVAQ